MKYSVSILLFTSVTLLGGCGSSSTSSTSTTADATVTSQGTNTGDLAASYDEGTDTVTASDGTNSYNYSRSSFYDKGAIQGYGRNTSTWGEFAAHGETSSGSGAAYLIDNTEDGYEAAVTFLERTGTTVVPGSGAASFSGDYVAMDYYDDSGDPVYNYVIEGDVSLSADFDAMTMSGTISNRAASGQTYADLILEDSAISGGGFGGSLSGGEVMSTGSTASGGSYAGLLTGADATEAVGSVYLPHSVGGSESRFETGIFIAEQPLP